MYGDPDVFLVSYVQIRKLLICGGHHGDQTRASLVYRFETAGCATDSLPDAIRRHHRQPNEHSRDLMLLA